MSISYASRGPFPSPFGPSIHKNFPVYVDDIIVALGATNISTVAQQEEGGDGGTVIDSGFTGELEEGAGVLVGPVVRVGDQGAVAAAESG